MDLSLPFPGSHSTILCLEDVLIQIKETQQTQPASFQAKSCKFSRFQMKGVKNNSLAATSTKLPHTTVF
jgi:hypothetical protein